MKRNSEIICNSLDTVDMKFTMIQFKSLAENLNLEVDRFAEYSINTLNNHERLKTRKDVDENTTQRSMQRFVNSNVTDALNSDIERFAGSTDCLNKINTTKAWKSNTNQKISGKSNTIVTRAQIHDTEMSSIRKVAESLSDVYSKSSRGENRVQFETEECLSYPLQFYGTVVGDEKEMTESINKTSENGKIKDLLFDLDVMESFLPFKNLSSDDIRFDKNNSLSCYHFDLCRIDTRENIDNPQSVSRNRKELKSKYSVQDSQISMEWLDDRFTSAEYFKENQAYIELSRKKLHCVKRVGENGNGIIKSGQKVGDDTYIFPGRSRKKLSFEQNEDANLRVEEFPAVEHRFYTKGGNGVLGSIENILDLIRDEDTIAQYAKSTDEERLNGMTKIPSRLNGLRNLSEKCNEKQVDRTVNRFEGFENEQISAASKKKLNANTGKILGFENEQINAASEKKLDINTNEQINTETEKKLNANTGRILGFENEQINAASEKKLDENTNERINAETEKKLDASTGKSKREKNGYRRKGENKNIDCKRKENKKRNKIEDSNMNAIGTDSVENTNKETEEVERVEDNNVMKSKNKIVIINENTKKGNMVESTDNNEKTQNHKLNIGEKQKKPHDENKNDFVEDVELKDSKKPKVKESRTKNKSSKNSEKSHVGNINEKGLEQKETHYKNRTDLDEDIGIKKDSKNGKVEESRTKDESSKHGEKSHVENLNESGLLELDQNNLESGKRKNGQQDTKKNKSCGEIVQEKKDKNEEPNIELRNIVGKAKIKTRKIDDKKEKKKSEEPKIGLRNLRNKTVGYQQQIVLENPRCSQDNNNVLIEKNVSENCLNSKENHTTSEKQLLVDLERISSENIKEIQIKKLKTTNSIENIKQSNEVENSRNKNCDKENLVEISSSEKQIVNTGKVKKITGRKQKQIEKACTGKKLVEVKESVAKVNENEEVEGSSEKQTGKGMIEEKDTVNKRAVGKKSTEINCDNLRRSKRINSMLAQEVRNIEKPTSIRQSNRNKSKRSVQKSKAARGKSKLETINDENEENICENNAINQSYNEYIKDAVSKAYKGIDKDKSLIEKSTENIYLVEEGVNTFPDKAANTSICKKKRLFSMINKIYPQQQERKRAASDSFVNDIIFIAPSNSRRKTVIPKKSVLSINTLMHASSSKTNTLVRTSSSSNFSEGGNCDKQMKDDLRQDVLRKSMKQFTSTPLNANMLSTGDPNKLLKRKRKQNKGLFEVDISKVDRHTEESSTTLKKRKMFSMEDYVNSSDFLKTVTSNAKS